MNQPYDATISPDADTLNACERLIERYAPGLMRAGGGSLVAEKRQKPRTASEATLTRNAEVIRLAKDGTLTMADIARKMGMRHWDVSSILGRAGVAAKPAYNAHKNQKVEPSCLNSSGSKNGIVE